jgi:hypothetical protein
MKADRWRVNAVGASHAVEFKLRTAREDVTDLPPVYQVAAVPDGNAGKIFKAAVYEIKILTHAAHAGVGIKTGDDWIFVSHFMFLSK